MIIVTLVATLASAMIWQQWRAVQVESAERARVQSAWILSGALDFARLILKETASRNSVTALTDPWATPLAESRLSTFLGAETSDSDDGPEAFLSGNITDAQSRYNLSNLVVNGQISTPERDTLSRLCELINVDSGVASRIATGMLTSSLGTASGPLRPQQISQLSWFGVDPVSIEALKPFLVILTDSAGNGVAAPVNVNTAPAEVLAAVTGIDLGGAERLVQMRQSAPFKELATFTKQLPSPQAGAAPLNIGVQSSYFEVRGRIRLVDHVLTERSLVQLLNGKQNVLSRERIAGLEQVGS